MNLIGNKQSWCVILKGGEWGDLTRITTKRKRKGNK